MSHRLNPRCSFGPLSLCAAVVTGIMLGLGALSGGAGSAAEGAAKPPRHAFVCQLGWFAPNHAGAGYLADTDFSVTPLEVSPAAGADPKAAGAEMDANFRRAEVRLMHDFGWTSVGPDFLFFSPDHVNRQIGLLRSYLDAIAAEGYTDFWAVPWLETQSICNKDEGVAIVADGVDKMCAELADRPQWLKFNGRPVILNYSSTSGSAEWWGKVFAALKAKGREPFWIYELGGLQPALFGTFPAEKYRESMDLFDGVYNFGASSLEAGAKMPESLRAAYGQTRAGQYIGATLWPDYLSARATNKNFIAPRRTEFFRNVWEAGLATNPDFLHFSTWNDYHESTTLDCSYSILTSRLEISQRYLCRYFGRELPAGSPDRPEAVLSYRKCLYAGEPLRLEFLPLPTRQGPAQGQWSLELRDENDRKLAEAQSPQVPLDKMEPWNWECPVDFDRAATRVVKVRPVLRLPDGREIRYANLPDVAIAVPVSYADQLVYSVPLHRLAGAERGLKLTVNQAVGATAHDEYKQVAWEPTGPGAAEAAVAVMRNAHPFRRMARWDWGGVELNQPDEPDHSLLPRPNPAGVKPGQLDWAPSETAVGEDYYAGLARFADGTWAYSPTVWTRPALPDELVAAQWIFAPKSVKETRLVPDRSGHGRDLSWAETATGLKFVKLPGNARALNFEAATALSAPADTAPNGPVAVEAVFRLRESGREQVICYQRGAQASLVCRKNGSIRRRSPRSRAVSRWKPGVFTMPSPSSTASAWPCI